MLPKDLDYSNRVALFVLAPIRNYQTTIEWGENKLWYIYTKDYYAVMRMNNL